MLTAMPALPFAAPENFSWAYLQLRRAFLRAWGPRGVSENERSTVSTAAPPNVSKNPDEQQVRFRVKSARGKQKLGSKEQPSEKKQISKEGEGPVLVGPTVAGRSTPVKARHVSFRNMFTARSMPRHS